MCLEELRKCEQARTAKERRQHALRAMSFARFANRIDARTPKAERVPPPADFVAALSGILARLSEKVDLSLPDAKPPPSD